MQPSIQSATNTLTRNSSIHDTGDYAIPQPHPHHAHHIITTTKSQSSLIRCGSCPGSTGVSRRGSSSESSPAGTVGNASIMGGSDGRSSVIGQGYYTDTGHYDRMPIPIPIVQAPPHHSLLNLGGMHSEDEIEPAYATVFPNPTANMPQVQQQMNYQVEDRSIYRRGARRWRKLYRINGHIFQAKRFNRVSFWGKCKKAKSRRAFDLFGIRRGFSRKPTEGAYLSFTFHSHPSQTLKFIAEFRSQGETNKHTEGASREPAVEVKVEVEEENKTKIRTILAFARFVLSKNQLSTVHSCGVLALILVQKNIFRGILLEKLLC